MENRKTALVIGVTGGIGGEVAAALLRRGWRVRALHRHPAEASKSLALQAPIEWVKGDAMKRDEVVAAADGAGLIVHGANPPGYRNWQGLVLPMLESTIAAAKAAHARIVFPGTVYNFGPDAFPLLSETSPQLPLTRKGRIRVEMERRLEAVSREGARVLVVRAGDYFGPHTTSNSWFSQGFVKAGRPVRSIVYPGAREAGHAFAYLPDVAETMVRLIEREQDLAPFDVFHFRGHSFEHGVEFAEAIRRVVGDPSLPIRRLPWWAVRAASPFVETFREMLEMRYLWQRTVYLDNSKLVAFLGVEPHTPTEQAIQTTLEGLGCLRRGIASGGHAALVA